MFKFLNNNIDATFLAQHTYEMLPKELRVDFGFLYGDYIEVLSKIKNISKFKVARLLNHINKLSYNNEKPFFKTYDELLVDVFLIPDLDVSKSNEIYQFLLDYCSTKVFNYKTLKETTFGEFYVKTILTDSELFQDTFYRFPLSRYDVIFNGIGFNKLNKFFDSIYNLNKNQDNDKFKIYSSYINSNKDLIDDTTYTQLYNYNMCNDKERNKDMIYNFDKDEYIYSFLYSLLSEKFNIIINKSVDSFITEFLMRASGYFKEYTVKDTNIYGFIYRPIIKKSLSNKFPDKFCIYNNTLYSNIKPENILEKVLFGSYNTQELNTFILKKDNVSINFNDINLKEE